MSRHNKGFGIVEGVLIIAAIALIGFVGWRAWVSFSNNKNTTAVNSTSQSQQVNPSQAPAITDNASLDQASAVLDATNVDGTESSQLNSETNF